MENKPQLTPEEQDLLYDVFGCSPERKKARLEAQKAKKEAESADPNNIASQIKKVFG